MKVETINWVLVVVAAILLLFGIKGKKEGFIKAAFSMLSVMLSLTGAVFAGPIIRSALIKSQVVADYLETMPEGDVTEMVVNAFSFVLAYMIIKIALSAVCVALDLVAKLPVLREVNETAGFFAGLAEGLLNVWIGFIVLTIFSETLWGKVMMDFIEDSLFLSLLFDNNLLYAVWDILP